MKTNSLSDERLVRLHRQKRINAFFTLYSRYRNYGYSIVCSQLVKFKLLNSLDSEKESIVFDAITQSLKTFDENKGSFKTLFSNICMNMTLKCISKFSRDPLADYVSLDESLKITDEMVFMDSVIINASDDQPNKTSDELKAIKKYYKGHYQRRILRMLEMKRDGFSYKEIGNRYQMSSKSVRAIFYRLKIRLDKEKTLK